jgi:hypothetical protein
MTLPLILAIAAMLGFAPLAAAEDAGASTANPLPGWTEPAKDKPGPVAAACPSPCCQEPACSFQAILYSWLPAQYGAVTLRGTTAPVAVSVSDTINLIDDMEFATMMQVEGHYGPYGMIFNGYYTKVSVGRSISRLDFSSDFEQAILDLALTYECAGVPEMLCLPPCSKFEALAGARYNMLVGGLSVTGPLGNTVSVGGSQDWIDLFVGGRLTVPLCNCLTLQVRGDIGGFDIGDASRFTWNIEAMLEYRTSPRCALIAGYRWLDIDRETGSGDEHFRYNVQLRGPVLGIAFDF